MPKIVHILQRADPEGVDPDALPPLPLGKPYAALCLIALHPEGMSRDQLIDYLWQNVEPSRARASVRQALHVLRKALGGHALTEQSGVIRLQPGTLTTDLASLDAAIESGDLETAHRLWHRGPFADFSLADAPAFNDWADRLRTRYETRLGEALAERARTELARGSAEDALPWFGRALDVRPFDERSHADRIEALLDLDALSEAEAALDQAVAAVDEPTPGVFEGLRERLRRQRMVRALVLDPVAERPVMEFVGRTREMAELRRHWRSARSSRMRTVVLLGPAGIGKTRLAEEFLVSSIGGDAAVVRARSHESERGLEYGLVTDLMKDLASQRGAAGVSSATDSVIHQLAPSLGNGLHAGPVGRPSDAAVADALLDLVESVANENPLALLVEDFHWADPASRTVLLRLTRSVRRHPVLLLLTCRSTDADQSAARILLAAAQERRMALVDLAPLTRAEVVEAVGLSFVVEPQTEVDGVAGKLFEASNGSPLFLVELIGTFHDDGIVERSEDQWVLWADLVPAEVLLPTSVRQLLRKRIQALSESARTLAGVLAASDRGMSVRLLEQECGLAPASAREGLNELLSQRTVVWLDAETLTFAHDALREVVRWVVGAGGPRSLARRQNIRRMAVAAVVAALATVAWLATRPQGRSAVPPPPYGGGTLVLVDGGAMRQYRLAPTGSGPEWTELPLAQTPRELRRPVTALDRNGAMRLFGAVFTDDGVPVAVSMTDDGHLVPLYPHDGDVSFQDLSPDGRFALLAVGVESEGGWRQDLVRLDLEGGEARTLYSPPSFLSAAWARDGSTVIVAQYATEDSLVLLRPDGLRLGARAIGANASVFRHTTACGQGGRRVILAAAGPGEPGEIMLVDLEADVEIVVRPRAPLMTSTAACSPDGSAVAYVGRVGGVSRLIIQDIASGDTLVGPTWASYSPVRWHPDEPFPVPTEVRVADEPLVLARGSFDTVRVRVVMSHDREPVDVDVSWTSLDPLIAYVIPGGRVFASRGGQTRLVAAVDGWITDTLDVIVEADSVPASALLADGFAAFDAMVWAVFGSPVLRPVQHEGGPALAVTGDGVGADGIRSLESFVLSRGGTLEVDYKLPLTRRDRQGVAACLGVSNDSESASDVDASWFTESICYSHPVGELSVFDSTGFTFASSVLVGPHSRPDLLPSDDWRHLAIVLAPDGSARLLLEQQEVARLAVPVHNGADVRWSVSIQSRAADTELLIRNLVLWEGMMY